ncbi:hypothetical protein ACJX0J_018120 [Zea mays]
MILRGWADNNMEVVTHDVNVSPYNQSLYLFAMDINKKQDILHIYHQNLTLKPLKCFLNTRLAGMRCFHFHFFPNLHRKNLPFVNKIWINRIILIHFCSDYKKKQFGTLIIWSK